MYSHWTLLSWDILKMDTVKENLTLISLDLKDFNGVSLRRSVRVYDMLG